jgi:Ca2+-binding EF-hand superfamily protein
MRVFDDDHNGTIDFDEFETVSSMQRNSRAAPCSLLASSAAATAAPAPAPA